MLRLVAALDMAKRRGYVAGNAVSRSDRGSQHAGARPAEWAAANDVRLSAGRTGCCRGRAVAESLWASLKNETCCRAPFATRAEAKVACVGWAEGSCNRPGPHSSIGCRHPADVMGEFVRRTGAALEKDLGGGDYLAA